MPNRVNRILEARERTALADAENLVFVDYRGLSATEAGALRRTLGERDLKMRVVRNRMLLRALSEAGMPDCAPVVAGPTAVIDAECPVTAARVALEFARRHPALELKGGLIEGEIFDRQAIETLARQGRTKAEWKAALAAAVLSPFMKIAGCAKIGGLVAGAVQAIIDKGSDGGAPEAA